MKSTDFYQSVIHAVWVNNNKKPFNDPRVRRAMHLALIKPHWSTWSKMSPQ